MSTEDTPAWPLWATDHDAAGPAAPQEASTLGLAAPCPECGMPVRPDQRYCENCGADVHPDLAFGASGGAASEATVKLNRPRPARRACLECGGEVDADGYCQTCGAKAPSPRDHFEAAPASWLGGVCDRGLVHARNEDAMALWTAAEPDRSAVLVVCDGVSSSQDSDVAAMAAAETARDVLADAVRGLAGSPDGDDTDPGTGPLHRALVEAAARANDAVVAHTAPDSDNAASCTFAAAVVVGDRVHWAGLGDSRVYLLTDTAQVQLSTDHSGAEELIRAGVPREQAETGLHAHAITRWLGRDAEDVVPDTGVHPVTGTGWLLVCTDGLWNYASAPGALAEQLLAAGSDGADPVAVASRLVKWANAQGGKDNVTVALARLEANLSGASQAPTAIAAESTDAPGTSVEEKI